MQAESLQTKQVNRSFPAGAIRQDRGNFQITVRAANIEETVCGQCKQLDRTFVVIYNIGNLSASSASSKKVDHTVATYVKKTIVIGGAISQCRRSSGDKWAADREGFSFDTAPTREPSETGS